MASTSGWISGIGFLVLACGGCQLVSGLNDLKTGSGGAGGAGVTVGTSATTGNSTTSTTHGTATGTSSTTSKSTGAFNTATTSTTATTTVTTSTTSTTATTSTSTGGGLVPCGNVTDTLQTLSMQTWLTSNAQELGGEVQINASVAMPGYLRLQATGTYDECYVTIEILNQQAQTTAWNGIVDASNPSVNFTEIGYSEGNQSIVTDTNGTTTMNTNIFNVQHLGLALHAGSVYFLHVQGAAGAWTFDGSIARPAWLNGATDAANISVTATTAGTRSANFRNFNIKPIALSDLP